MKMPSNTDAVILCGGYSSRMSSHKAFLPFGNNGTVIAHIADTYLAAGVSSLIVVLNRIICERAQSILATFAERGSTEIVINEHPEHGRFSSILCGLRASASEFSFIQNIDNPFVTEDMLIGMRAALMNGDFITPVYNGSSGHPVLIGKTVKEHLLKTDMYSGNLRDELMRFRKQIFECSEPGILLNINTDNDYEYAALKKGRIDLEKVNTR